MSFDATRAVWELSRRSGSHKLVLLCIAHHQNDTSGEAWPSIGRIADMCGLGRRQVFNIISDLEAGGEIRRTSGARHGQSNRYAVVIQAIQGVNSDAHLDAADRTPEGETDCTPPVQPTAPKPSMNRHQEPPVKEGRRRAAQGDQVLVEAGCSHEQINALKRRLRMMGKRSITHSEATDFLNELKRCPGWTAAEVVEEVGVPGGFSRMLHTFRAEFLPAHKSLQKVEPAVRCGAEQLPGHRAAGGIPDVGLGVWEIGRQPLAIESAHKRALRQLQESIT